MNLKQKKLYWVLQVNKKIRQKEKNHEVHVSIPNVSTQEDQAVAIQQDVGAVAESTPQLYSEVIQL